MIRRFFFALLAATAAHATVTNVADCAYATVAAAVTAANGGRSFSDGVITSGSTTLTSATASFTSADVSRIVGIGTNGAGGITIFSTIASVTNSTTAVMSRAATATVSSQTVTLGGDTLVLPACADGSVTWSSSLAISKSLQLIGAGQGVTNIRVDVAGAIPINVTITPTRTVRISSMTLKSVSAWSLSGMIFSGTTDAAGYPALTTRIDHVTMYGDPTDGSSTGGRYIFFGATYGLVDNCTFIGTTSRSAGNITLGTDNSYTTANTYHTPQTPGDINALYVEDCTYTTYQYNQGNGAGDNYIGAKYVWRNNTIYNESISNHGLDSQSRGSLWFELYNNTFISNQAGAKYLATIRSGTGVIWGNHINNLSVGYAGLTTTLYYRSMTAAGMSGGNLDLNAAPPVYYPAGTWGGSWTGMASPVDDGFGNNLTGAQPFDGNSLAPGHFDATTTRTVTDMVGNGTTTITSATAAFTGAAQGVGDRAKGIYGTNIRDQRTITDGVITSGTNLASATAAFNAGDVGRFLNDSRGTGSGIPHNVKIASVTNSTNAVLDTSVPNGTGLSVRIGGAFIVSVNSATSATLNCNVVAGTGQTLTIGFHDQGYPGLDQPGYGSFATANAGSWPTITTGYSAANFEALQPMYFFVNIWDQGDGPGSVSTDPYGTEAYVKENREYYRQNDSFTGATGCGSGTLAARPASGLTAGVGYWATDTNTLYVATGATTWSAYYTPLAYPHPMRNATATAGISGGAGLAGSASIK